MSPGNDVVRRHLWIGPDGHHHHLAFRAVGVSGGLSTRLTNPVGALLGLVDASQDRVLLYLAVQALLFISRDLAAPCRDVPSTEGS
jgi:hypothetical protein